MAWSEPPSPLRLANEDAALRHVVIHDLELMASIGIYNHERQHRQRIRVNLDLAVGEEPAQSIDGGLADIICGEQVESRVRTIIAAGHVNLVETLADRIAAACLEDRRVRIARVRVEKLDVFPDAASAGIEIERLSSFP